MRCGLERLFSRRQPKKQHQSILSKQRSQFVTFRLANSSRLSLANQVASLRRRQFSSEELSARRWRRAERRVPVNFSPKLSLGDLPKPSLIRPNQYHERSDRFSFLPVQQLPLRWSLLRCTSNNAKWHL